MDTSLGITCVAWSAQHVSHAYTEVFAAAVRQSVSVFFSPFSLIVVLIHLISMLVYDILLCMIGFVHNTTRLTPSSLPSLCLSLGAATT